MLPQPPSRTQPPLPAREHIPAELAERPQWVCWHYVQRAGDKKPQKVPLQITGKPASTTDAATWNTLDACYAAASRHRWGIGYVFTGTDGVFGIDLDNCRDPATGALTDWAQQVLALTDTYAEVSPSGTGIKLIALGKPAATGLVTLDGAPAHVFECYAAERYFTITGQYLAGRTVITPADVLASRLRRKPREQGGATPPAGARRTRATTHAGSAAQTPYGAAALDQLAREVAHAPEGTRNTTLNGAAYRAGRLVEGGHLDSCSTMDVLVSAAQQAGLPAHEAADVAQRALHAGQQAGPAGPAPSASAASTRKDAHPRQSAWLIEYAKQHAQFFHTPDDERYALVTVNGIRRTIPVVARGNGLRSWLSRAYYDAHGATVSRNALDTAIEVLGAYAEYDNPCHPVWLRVGYEQSTQRMYIDLADEQWRAVEIDADGWRIVTAPPVYFRRGQGMKPLPEPQRGGTLNELRAAFVPHIADADWMLLVGWLLGAVQPPGPGAIPALALQAEPGSGKTWLARALRRIVDDHEAAHGGAPRTEEDLIIEANHSHIITIDNLTRIDQPMSDLLCRMATGGTFTRRKLYTDTEASYITFKRPVILTSIADIVTAGDLLDRVMIVRLPRITAYRAERELEETFHHLHPHLLGALCDAISAGLRAYHATPTPNVRMADLARWVEACAPALGWSPGAFTEALRAARADSARLALDSDPLAEEIERLVKEHPVWEGTAQELYATLEQRVTMTGRAPRWWPADPSRLMQRLQKLTSDLRRAGIEITGPQQRRFPDGTRKRLIRIERAGAPAVTPTVTPVTPNHVVGMTAPPHSDAVVTPVTPVTPNNSKLPHVPPTHDGRDMPPVPAGVDATAWQSVQWPYVVQLAASRAAGWENGIRTHAQIRGIPPDVLLDAVLELIEGPP